MRGKCRELRGAGISTSFHKPIKKGGQKTKIVIKCFSAMRLPLSRKDF